MIALTGFQGANLHVDAHQLSEQIGVDAVDIEPGRDRFVPLKARVNRATVPNDVPRQAIYRMGRDVINTAQYWLSSVFPATYSRTFGEDNEITLIFGDGTPKWTSSAIGLGSAPYPQATRELSVPAPVTAPTASLTTPGAGTEGVRYYVWTWVNDRGWESAPSPPSNALTCNDGSIVAITGLEAAPAGNYGLTARRIYVTQPGTSSNTEFYFLREVTAATTSTTDDARQRGALLATYDGTSGSAWLPAPGNAHHILSMWNGMHACLSGSDLLVCEPDTPYAWPDKYRRSLKSLGVALGFWGQNLVVLTTGEPVVYQGVSPLGLTPLPADLKYPCLSGKAAVSFSSGVAWPSNDGLAWVGDGGNVLLTDKCLTPDQWRALSPSSMVAGRWRDMYVCSCNGGAKGFIIDPKAPDRIWWLSSGFDACHYDELSQAFFTLQSGNVAEFAAGSLMQGTFESKRYLQPAPTNYGYIKVTADAYPVAVTITARWFDPYDGTPRENIEVRSLAGPNVFTLSSGYAAESYQIKVQHSTSVQAVRIGNRADQLRF